MIFPRRTFLQLAAGAAALSSMPQAARAQAYPTRPVRLIVGFPAGGVGDVLARLIGQWLSDRLGQPVVIENRPGGGTTIGAAHTVQSPADGHTLFVNASSLLINAQLMKNLPYDMWKDFVPLTLAASNPHVLIAAPGLGTKNAREFIAQAKQKGDAMSYGSFGNGSSGHLAFELLKKTYEFKMVHVPYKGVPQAMQDVMAGQIHAMLTDLPPAVVQVKAGKVLGVAIAAERRSPALPDVPTFQEATGTRFVSRSWFGFLARAGTPPDVVKVLHTELVRALQNPGVKEKLGNAGMDTFGTSQEEFQAFMKSEYDRFADAIKFSGTKID
jgi:tripartite-type tricarboxylate transporter receptor subunit TctC